MSVYEAMMATRRKVESADALKVREVAGMTQKEMAQVLGVSVNYVKAMEISGTSLAPVFAYALDAIMDEAELQALARETGAVDEGRQFDNCNSTEEQMSKSEASLMRHVMDKAEEVTRNMEEEGKRATLRDLYRSARSLKDLNKMSKFMPIVQKLVDRKLLKTVSRKRKSVGRTPSPWIEIYPE